MNDSNQNELLLSDDEHKQLLSSIAGGLYTAGQYLHYLASTPRNPSLNIKKKIKWVSAVDGGYSGGAVTGVAMELKKLRRRWAETVKKKKKCHESVFTHSELEILHFLSPLKVLFNMTRYD